MSQPYLIVGADGLLGGSLRRHWRAAGRPVVCTSLLPVPDPEGVLHFDLSQPTESWPPLPPGRAAVLCAAITSLDQCRRDPEATRFINVTQTLALARQLVENGAFVVFISSNLVFDGTKPCRGAAELTCPQTEYGRQKADAESGLAQFGQRVAVVRLTKVFHPALLMVRGWIDALRGGTPIHPFSDFVCSPIALPAVTRALATIAESEQSSIWQFSGSADVSYADLATHIADRFDCDPALVQPRRGRGAGHLEHLPRHTTLDATRAQQHLGFDVCEPKRVTDTTFFP